MSERKVLNKYYPPDFDITKLPKLHLSRDRQFVIRIMAPFSMRCKTCGEYIYKGRKFNARQETVQDETYLGLRIFRFYIRCPKCISEITFKTDPENTDYQMEEGATRNFQARRFAQVEDERQKKEKEDEELNNPMKALENRTQESKQEMDLLEKLEELKELNQRHAKLDHQHLLQENWKSVKDNIATQEEEDEALVREIFNKQKASKVRRLVDEDSDEDQSDVLPCAVSVTSSATGSVSATDILTHDPSAVAGPSHHLATGLPVGFQATKPKLRLDPDNGKGKVSFGKGLAGLVVVKKKRPHSDTTTNESAAGKMPKTMATPSSADSTGQSTSTASSLGLLGDYDSSSNDSSD